MKGTTISLLLVLVGLILLALRHDSETFLLRIRVLVDPFTHFLPLLLLFKG